MVADMSYTAVSTVVESWEGIRRTKDYEEVAGVKLFRRYALSSGSTTITIFLFDPLTRFINCLLKQRI
jgi:hypothetical protein